MSVMRYTEDHEWLRVDDGDIATVGITDHAQSQLGDLVMVELPAVGKDVVKGAEVVVVESVKAASEVKAPVSGSIVEINEALASAPARPTRTPPARVGFSRSRCPIPPSWRPSWTRQPITGLSKIDPRLVELIGRELAKVQGGIYRCPASGSRWKFWSKEASPAGISGQARPTNRQ